MAEIMWRDFRLPLWHSWGLRSSGTLHSALYVGSCWQLPT